MKPIPLLEGIKINEASKSIKDFLAKNKESIVGSKIIATIDGKAMNGVVKSVSASSSPSGISVKVEHSDKSSSYHTVKEHLLQDFVSKKEIELFNGDKLKLS